MWFEPITPVPLTGAYNTLKQPQFSFHSFYSKTYQDSLTDYIKHEFPFRSDLVRLYNQLNFSLFHRVNTLLTVGKNDYLFDHKSIRAANGQDFLADPDQTKEEVTNVVNFLNQHNIPLLMLIAPNKALFHESQLMVPLTPSFKSNYNFTINTYKALKIQYIDAGLILKNSTSSYPLFPKQAAHWSIYGASIVLDSMISNLNSLIPEAGIQSKVFQCDTSASAKFTDNDYVKMLNLMSEPKTESFLYPQIGFKTQKKPKVLFIGDSFFWSFYDLNFVQKVFDQDSRFIYYYKTHYNLHREQIDPIQITSEDLKKFDLIVICSGHENLAQWNFDFFKDIHSKISHS